MNERAETCQVSPPNVAMNPGWSSLGEAKNLAGLSSTRALKNSSNANSSATSTSRAFEPTKAPTAPASSS